jgi:aldehyde dehydrogenase (NAD+)
MEAADVEQAIEIVNNTRYGLSASIVTRSLAAAHAFARGVDTGCVAVNLPTVGWDVHTPFGGFKDSGSPYKEHGIEGLQFYTRVKSVAMRVGGI